MTAEYFNLFEATILWISTILLLLISVKRKYPVRSVIVYGALTTLGWIQWVTAVGALSLYDVEHLRSIATLARATGIVLGLALLLWESRY